MFRLMKTMCDFWIKEPPYLRFATTLPFVEEHFISGDSPVLIVHFFDNPVWVPTAPPKQHIGQVTEIFTSPRYEVSLPLSPYVFVTLHRRVGPAPPPLPETMDPTTVRTFNNLIRGQSKVFTIARDKESLSQ
jgi:hypothetical protein